MSGPEGSALDVRRDQKGRFHFVEKCNSEERKDEASLDADGSHQQGKTVAFFSFFDCSDVDRRLVSAHRSKR